MPEESEYDKWNERLKYLNVSGKRGPFFKEGEIWWCSIGLNVGFEENGKGELCNRPVFILKKLNNAMFIGIPISSVKKEGKYYFPICMRGGRNCVVLLSQIRVFDSRRLTQRIMIVGDREYFQIRKAIKGLL